MQKLFVLSVCFVVLVSSTAFKKKKNKPKALPESSKSIMSAMKPVGDKLYASQIEVTNAQYAAFMAAMKIQEPETFSKYAIDTTGWVNTSVAYNTPYVNYYHKHPAFNDYPIVNISHDNAVAYCNWLTKMYNEDEKRKFKRVQFMLPNVEQWEQAASAGRKQAVYPWGSFYVRNRKGEFMANFRVASESNMVTDSATGRAKELPVTKLSVGDLNDKHFYTASVFSFFPNDFGLYNCSGNVAEMVSTSGVAKGGSWHSYGGEIQIKSTMNYTKPNPEVGFRVFMQVVED